MASIAQDANNSQAKVGRNYTVYAIRCNVNGRIYVGCSVNVEARIRQHFSDLQKGNKRTGPWNAGEERADSTWQTDFNLYGQTAFDYYILQKDVPKTERLMAENAWIDRLHARDPEHGYNQRSSIREPLPFTFVEGIPPMAGTGPFEKAPELSAQIQMKNRPHSPIFGNIKRLCEERKITISELEKAVKVGNGTISKWDRHYPGIDKLMRVADFLGVTGDYLLEESEDVDAERES